MYYKIRRKKDGLYSSGGVYPTFVEHGFRWLERKHLVGHLDFAIGRQPDVYRGCEILEVEEVIRRVVSPFELLGPEPTIWDKRAKWRDAKEQRSGK